MYRFVIFDLDGTLAYTLQDLANSVNYALDKNGFATYSVDDYRKMVGSGAVTLLKRASKTEDETVVSILKKDFDEYYSNHFMDTTVAYDGAETMLKNLQKNNIKIGVLSNKPNKFVSNILKMLYPDIKFNAMWGKKPQFEVKPNPQSLNALMLEIGAERENTVYVGDSNVDVLTAKNGKVDFIGCSWGFRGEKELIETGADIEKIAHNNIELEKLILGETNEQN